MGDRRARFHWNCVRDVYLLAPIASSPASSASEASSDDFDGPLTPPSIPVSLPAAPKPRIFPLPDVSTPYLLPSSLPVHPDSPLVYKSSSLRTLMPAYSTPSPKASAVHMHPFLQSLHWDPRGKLPILSPSKRDSPATEPPLPKLVLSTGSLPWMVNVRAPSTSLAVTVGDIFDSLHSFFHTHVTRVEWDAAGDRKEKIRLKFRVRCGVDKKELAEGVKRMDYLPEGAVIIGLGQYPGARKESLNMRWWCPRNERCR